MKENARSFTEGLLQSLIHYWNEFLLALPRVVLGIVVLVIIFVIASYFSKLIKSKLSGESHDPLFVRFLSKVARFIIITVGIIFTLQILGLTGIAKGLLAGAGVGAFIFGFAFKDIAENFLGGIILAFNRPFNLNDSIMINDFSGHVIALNFRTTQIKTFDEKDVFLPNAMVIKQPLINLTRDGKIRLDFAVGIAYEDDIQTAIDTILETIKPIENIKHEIQPFAVVEELSVSTVNLRVYFWTNTFDYKKGILQIKGEVITKVKEALTAKGITLPADIQEIKLYDKKEPLPINILNFDEIKKLSPKL